MNAIFLDECFENLDEGSSERVLELIAQIDTPNVFVITQRQGIKELIPSAVRVEKRGGMATIY
jgi:DNA repair exonuclease SbcCD ATPase subunit